MRYITQEEIDTAIKQTKIDLFELAKEIGQNEFFEIFDEYSPEDDEQCPSYLIESLFGNLCYLELDKVNQLSLVDDYIMGVWKRCTTRQNIMLNIIAVSYTHLRAHETVLDLVCRLLLEKKNSNT